MTEKKKQNKKIMGVYIEAVGQGEETSVARCDISPKMGKEF